MSKHTPGPWDLERHFGEPLKVVKILSDTESQPICAIGYAGKASIEEANAALMAAAPELLAACEVTLGLVKELARDNVAEYAYERAALEAAIAKAEG